MKAVYHIARLTFTDAIRNRALHGILVFAVFLLLISAALTSVTMGRPEMMIHDVGMGLLSLFANLMAIIFITQDLQQDKTNRTLYVLVGRIRHRFVYILGKFAGASAILAIAIAGMYALLACLVAVFGQIAWVSSIEACGATIIEAMIVIALAMIMAQSSSFFLAIMMTMALDIAGRHLDIIRHVAEQSGNALIQGAGWLLVHILPDLEHVSLRAEAGYLPAFPLTDILGIGIYGITEIALLLALASFIFNRRNLS